MRNFTQARLEFDASTERLAAPLAGTRRPGSAWRGGVTAFVGAMVIVAGFCVQPAAAQTTPDPDLTLRRCVIARLPKLAAAVRAHMQGYRSANPQATQDQISGERRTFIKVTQKQNAGEVAAAKQACQANPAAPQ